MARTRRIALSAVLVMTTAVGLEDFAPTASAAPIESFIGFGFADDGTPIGEYQVVTDQYRDGDGIVFVPNVVNVTCGESDSICDAASTGQAVASAPPDGEFRWKQFGIQFTDFVRDSVSFDLRAMVGAGDVPYTIQAYDREAGRVAVSSGTIGQTWETVTMLAPSPEERIAFVRVDGGVDGNVQLLIDNVRSTGDTESPPASNDTPATVAIYAPVSGHYYPDTMPLSLDFETLVTSVQPLASVTMSVWHGSTPSSIDEVVLCGPAPAPPCPPFEFRHTSTVSFDERGSNYVEVNAATLFSVARPQTASVHIRNPLPVEHVIGAELNQGVQGKVNVVDDDALTPQPYRSYARLIPGKDTLIRRYHATTFESRRWTAPKLPVTVRRQNGATTYVLDSILTDGATSPVSTKVWDATDPDSAPLLVSELRRSLNSTANYVLPGSLTADAIDITIGGDADPDRFVATFDERPRLGINVLGLFDDTNSIDATTLEEFSADGLPVMDDMMPYATIEPLSYRAAQWAELPHSSNDNLDDPEDIKFHEPGCAIAASMRLWGFGSEAERTYADLTNSWVVDAGVMANGKSNRGMRGCAFTFLAPLREGGTFVSDLDETLVHEAGHIHDFPHATNLHDEAGGEAWPLPHGSMSGIEAIGTAQFFTTFGVRIAPDDAGDWQIGLVDPCTQLALADCLGGSNHRNVRHDVMSYGPNRWPSVITWNRFYDQVVNGIGRDAVDPDLAGPFALAAGAEVDDVDAVLVTGRLQNDGSWVLDSAITKPVPAGALDYADPVDPDFVIRGVDAGGAIIAQRAGKLGSTEDNVDGFIFMAPLLANPAIAAYEVVVDGAVVATLGSSGGAPLVTDLTVTEREGDFITASWTIVDPGDDGHTTVLWVSYDGGDSWLPGAWVQPGQANSTRLWVGDAPPGAEFTLRVISSDGFSSARVEVTGSKCLGHEPTIVGDGGRIEGTNGVDVILGTTGDDMIDALRGDDIVCGAGGDDIIDGGRGADVLSGGSGDDVIDGGRGSDTINGGDGDDVLIGGPGDDIISGGSGRNDVTA